MTSLRSEYRRLLEHWVGSALPFLYVPPERPDIECYGTGYDGWGVQTNQKAFSAFAVLAADPELDEERVGLSRDDLADHALRMLRFSLASHTAGGYHCTDGGAWGHTWISALGIERMMHAVDELGETLSDNDSTLLQTVLLSECDWLVDSYMRSTNGEPGAVQAGLTANNDPESNLWNGSLLHRTAMMYPEAPRAAEYREQGTTFLLAGISTPQDERSDEVVDGVRVGDRFVGANFFPSFALNHHGYLNVGYMVICLSQVAMAHFAWKRRGIAPPEALYRRVPQLWNVVRSFTFPDGRLGRIGGATRARYCYCQDYAVPTWILAADYLGEVSTATLESAWLRTLRREIAAGDGASFLSARLSRMAEVSPTYYTRLESDRACSLSMALCWRRHFENEWRADRIKRDEVTANTAHAGGSGAQGAAGDGGASDVSALTWSDDYHGATFVRGPRRFASWTWRAAELPQGLCVPTGSSDMAEWRWNLAGRLLGVGARNVCELIDHGHQVFDGGFVNAGRVRVRSEGNLAEGEADKLVAVETIAFAALPDDATVLGIQFATAVNRAFFRSVKGVHLIIPNDVFNGSRRVYYTDAGSIEAAPAAAAPVAGPAVLDAASSWINVDDKLTLSIPSGDNLRVVRPAERQITIRDKPFEIGSLAADELCSPVVADTRAYSDGQPVLDVGFVVRVGEDHETAERREAAGADRVLRGEGFRGVLATGRDGREYLLLLGVADSAGADAAREATIRIPGRAPYRRQLRAGSATLLELGSADVDVLGDTTPAVG